MTPGMGDIAWRPGPNAFERTRIGRFMREQGIATVADLQSRSVSEPAWYWDAVVRHLGVRFTRPYQQVLDASRGLPWPRWFVGGLLNFSDNCLDRNLDAGRAEKTALAWEGDDGATRTVSYAVLGRDVARLANALGRIGVGKGDRVGVFLPMSPESATRSSRSRGSEPSSSRASPASAPRRWPRGSATARRRCW